MTVRPATVADWPAVWAVFRQVVAGGDGFTISTEAQAMSRGLEGQEVRVRTESGRVVVGRAVGDHRVALAL